MTSSPGPQWCTPAGGGSRVVATGVTKNFATEFRVMILFAGHARHDDVASWVQRLCTGAGFASAAVVQFDVVRDADHDLLKHDVQQQVL